MFPPVRFDDYEVVRPLADGAMGTVYLGRDLLLDRPVALKFIAASNADPRAHERFLAEARALARLDHPNVVSVYRISSVSNRPYIAYEFVDGSPLHRLPRPVPWREVLHIALGLARGLAAVHASGLLHRDIKPSNAVVGRDGVVKLLDFGLAEQGAWSEPSTDHLIARLAARGGETARFSGTPVYMAPELAAQAPASGRSDIYSLGVVLWELLAGDLPYADRDPEDTVAFIFTHGLSPIGQLRRDVPAPLANLIGQCVSRAADQRPRTAAAVRDRLELLGAVYAPLVADSGADAVAESKAARRLVASFERAAAVPTFAPRLYHRLCEELPELRAHLASDLAAQHQMLLATLSTVVHGARSPEIVVPLLEDLGHRQVEHGVRGEHLDGLGRAVLTTLAELDAGAWTPALANLWSRAVQRITTHVRRGISRAVSESSGVTLLGGAPGWRDPEPPETRYVRSGDAVIAYQTFGEGPRDLVIVPGWVSHLELAWQEPGFAALMSRLARRARVTVYDRRGTGLSDRDVTGLGAASDAAELLAVMDAAGVDRAILVGLHEAEAVTLMVAATHPERIRALVIWGGTPSLVRRIGFDHGQTLAELEGWLAELHRRWGEPLFLDTLAPSRVDDETFRVWWGRYLRSGATPSSVTALVRAHAALDLRSVLPAIRMPTLVLRHAGDRVASRAASDALSAGIVGARLIELDGTDHLPYAQATEAIVVEIEGFFGELPTASECPVRLATVMVVRMDEPGALRGMHGAIEAERGILLDDPRGPAAIFRAPIAAMRALRAGHPGVRSSAAILVQVVPAHGHHAEGVLVDAAWSLAATTPAGEVCLSPTARDLIGDHDASLVILGAADGHGTTHASHPRTHLVVGAAVGVPEAVAVLALARAAVVLVEHAVGVVVEVGAAVPIVVTVAVLGRAPARVGPVGDAVAVAVARRRLIKGELRDRAPARGADLVGGEPAAGRDRDRPAGVDVGAHADARLGRRRAAAAGAGRVADHRLDLGQHPRAIVAAEQAAERPDPHRRRRARGQLVAVRPGRR